jgi:hypothetical protein
VATRPGTNPQTSPRPSGRPPRPVSAHRNPHARGTEVLLRRSCGGLARSAEAPKRLPNTWRRTRPHPQRDEESGSCKCSCQQLREQLPAHNPHPQVGTHVQNRLRRSWLGGAGGTGPKRRAAMRCPTHQGCAETADEAPGKDLSVQVSLAYGRGGEHTHTHHGATAPHSSHTSNYPKR